MQATDPAALRRRGRGPKSLDERRLLRGPRSRQRWARWQKRNTAGVRVWPKGDSGPRGTESPGAYQVTASGPGGRAGRETPAERSRSSVPAAEKSGLPLEFV